MPEALLSALGEPRDVAPRLAPLVRMVLYRLEAARSAVFTKVLAVLGRDLEATGRLSWWRGPALPR